MENANNYFGSCNGTDNFYCHRPSLMLYTDGVKMMAEKSRRLLINLFNHKPSMQKRGKQRALSGMEVKAIKKQCFYNKCYRWQ